ncbi:MAG: Uma2 family endonuclease [Candidatus Eremiobacteraeota bacterium]|nr:Uma2 family endonuclease [Candidatus Eremiobacteraeota bacterium]
MAAVLKPRTFTVDEYHRMAETGVLAERERIELLNGLLVEMSPIGDAHWLRHAELVRYLLATLGEKALVAGQLTLPLGDRDEPEPDIAVLAPSVRTMGTRRVAPSEIFALVEISDSSLAKDLGPKRLLYARFGILDYLVVDLNADRLVHFSNPRDLDYSQRETLSRDDKFELASFSGVTLEAKPFLSPPAPKT